jgi:hypothetical protein
MFLHLGADTVIPISQVIAITDLKFTRAGSNKVNHEFIQTMREENLIIDVSENNIKSFVITDKVVYLSAISALTLKKRAGHIPESQEY